MTNYGALTPRTREMTSAWNHVSTGPHALVRGTHGRTYYNRWWAVSWGNFVGVDRTHVK